MHVKGWVKSTLVDYPGKVAVSFFCGGCNFCCPNCHNPALVLHPEQSPDVSEDEIWAFLSKRRGLLDGIVISGGEPTLQPDLPAFAMRAHEMGYHVKLDTNGYRPVVLKALIDARAVDYVAMDVKAPLADYGQAAGRSIDVGRIEQSISLLRTEGILYEFRTTVVPGLLVEQDIESIARSIRGARTYYLQQFSPHNTLDPEMQSLEPYPPERIRAMAELARLLIPKVGVRGL